MDLDDTASSQPRQVQRRASNETQLSSRALAVAPSSSQRKKSRTSGGSERSDVWKGFVKLEILNPDNAVRVEQVQCKLCHQILAYSSGTSSLRYHLSTHEKGARLISNRVSSIPYDHANARRALVKFIAATGQHLGLGSNPHFISMIREGFNPNYEPVSRSTIVKDLIDFFEHHRKNHMTSLASAPDYNVSCAVDIWSGGNKQDYLSVTLHYIDREYHLHRKVVGFELVDARRAGKNVSDCINSVAEDWSFANRVFAITMDNVSYSDTTIDELRKNLKSNVGGEILHQCCAVDIINLMVRTGMEAITPMLEDIRSAVKYVNTPSQRVNRWKLKCRANNKEECLIAHDIPSQWSSTYVMLERLLPYADIFTTFVQEELGGEAKNLLITDQHWVVARAICEILKVLYNWAIHISASEVPTSHLAIHMVYEMSIAFQECNIDHALIGAAVTAMAKVWEKYFWPMPMLYCYAFILDPRIRIDGLASWFSMLKRSSKLDYEGSLEITRESVFRAYRLYELKCVARHVVVLEDPHFTASPVERSWQHFYEAKAKKKKLEEQSGSSNLLPKRNELKLYLKAKFIDIEPINLDILQWWRNHEAEFPILSIFAQDVLTVPMSSVSSENAFNLAGRVMDDKLSQLRPKLVKILACVKDWEREKLKAPTEFSKDHNEWIEAFNEWNIGDN